MKHQMTIKSLKLLAQWRSMDGEDEFSLEKLNMRDTEITVGLCFGCCCHQASIKGKCRKENCCGWAAPITVCSKYVGATPL